MNAVSLVVQAGLVAKAVLLILLGFSLMSWTLIFMKFGLFRRAQRESARFLHTFRSAKNLTTVFEESKRFVKSPIVSVFQEGYRELSQLVKGGQGQVNQWPAPMRQKQPLPKCLFIWSHLSSSVVPSALRA